MRRLEEFRLFYNHTIHPELMRMERKRRRLLLLLLSSIVLLLIVLALQFYLKVLVLSLFLLLPFGVYVTYLLYRIQQFRTTFKPRVVNLLLDFLDDSLNYGTLRYDSKRFIPKSRFLASQLFVPPATSYHGEDFIEGKIGELDFEMCELSVRELSRVRNRLNYTFRGIFMHTVFTRPLRGEMIILPREYKQYVSRTIRAFDRKGGKVIEKDLSSDFKEAFLTYATKETNILGLLPEEMQKAIVNYRIKSGKEIYVSFLGNDIYVAITEPKDILEPYIFKSNVSFELVREFFEDLYLLISFIEDFDKNN